MSDPLAELITLLKPRTMLAGSLTGQGSWGVRSPYYKDPSFYLVTQGQCYFVSDEGHPLQLSEGDYLLVPHPIAAAFVSHPGVPTPIADAAFKTRHGNGKDIQLGDSPDDAPITQVIGGLFICEPANANLLIQLLPPYIHIQSSQGIAASLKNIIALITEESQANRPGKDLILARLVEVMLIEALRVESTNPTLHPKGLLGGLAEPRIAESLQHIHADVARNWTVANLAKSVGMSRAAFARHFTTTVGIPPVQYLLEWRMALAKEALLKREASLNEISDAIGYQSASAFSTAFTRMVGCPPSQYASTISNETVL